MSTTHKVISGDTFETIARRVYGTELEATRIASSNPGATLTEGSTVIIPSLPGAPQDAVQNTDSDNENEIAILIDSERFRFWDRVTIRRSIDAMDTAFFSAPFQANIPGFRETFRPVTYKTIVITSGDNPLFKGTMIDIMPSLNKERRTISVDCYSLPGVLNDCTPPAGAFSDGTNELEFSGQTLREIATTIAGYFGIAVFFDVDPGPAFDQIACRPNQKTLAFLIDAAKQRNIIISSTPKGELLFLQSVSTGNPVARLQQGNPPLLSVTPFFNPQQYYSYITGLEPSFFGLPGSQFTVNNPRLANVVRPFTFEAPDTEGGETKAAVESKMGRMFGSVVTYAIQVATWRDAEGNLWTPNTLINVLAPDAMIYSEYTFIIRAVEFNREKNNETATLELVLPGSFSGEIPEALPWDG